MSERPTTLIVDSSSLARRGAYTAFTRMGVNALTAGSLNVAVHTLEKHPVHVVLLDVQIGEPGATVARLRNAAGEVEIWARTARHTLEEAEAWLSAGADQYLERALNDRFIQRLRRLPESRPDDRFERGLGSGVHSRQLLGSSLALKELRTLLERLAPSRTSVLVLGESGVGKELVARTLHDRSGRSGEFFGINCATFPENMIEAELFGWERGAHSTADRPKAGLLERADQGTLLLDEVGDMPQALQVKLLRLLSTRRFTRLGGVEDKVLSARIVAATNRDLEECIAAGRFREDLYYRLAGITVKVPPLRDRLDDVEHLAWHFVNEYAREEGRAIDQVSPAVIQALRAYPWPGNVRELRNALQVAVVWCRGRRVELDHLPEAVRGSTESAPEPQSDPEPASTSRGISLPLELEYQSAKKQVLREFTTKYLRYYLINADGNIQAAASAAGMHRPNFKRLMRRYDVEVEDIYE